MRKFFQKNKNLETEKTSINTGEIFRNGSNLIRENRNLKENQEKRNVFTGIFDKIIAISFFMIFFGVPLFFTGLSFQGIVFEKQIYFYFWTLLALVAWVSKGVVVGELKIRKTPLDIPILLFWVIYGLATFFSVDRWHSFWGFFGDPSGGFVSLTAIIVLYYLIVSNYSLKKMQWALGGFVVSNVLIVIWSVITFLGIKFVPNKVAMYFPLSFMGTVSGLKVFVGMSIPIIMMLFFKLSENRSIFAKITKYLLLLLIPLNLFLILLFYQKILAMVVLFGVGFFLLFILANIVRVEKRVIWVPMMTFVLATIVLIIGGNNLAKINAPIEVTPSVKVSWEVAKDSLKNNLLLGTGPASYGFNFSKYKPEIFNNNIFYDLRFYRGTGLFFDSLSTIGILGTIILLVVLITFINVALYLVGKDKEKDKLYSLGLLATSLVGIFSLLIIRLEGTLFILTGAFIALSMITMLNENSVEEKYLNLSLKASPKFALTLAFVFIIVSAGVATLFVYIGKAYVADIYAGKNMYSKNVSEESISNILRAISLNKREGRYFSRAAQEYAMLANNEAVKIKSNDANSIKKIKNYLSNSLLYATQGVNLMPNDVLAVSVQAQVNESLAMYDPEALKSALDNYKKLMNIEPNSPTPYFKSGQIEMLMAMGEKDKAKKKQLLERANDYFEKSVSKKKDFADGYFYLSLAKNALNDKDGAIKSLTEAVRLEQNNIAYLYGLGKLYQERGKKGDLDDAKKIYNYILSVNPNNVNVDFSLALLYEKQGDRNKAIEYYNKTIDLIKKSKNKDKDNVIEQIKKMIDNVRNGISNNDIISGAMKDVDSNNNEKQKIDAGELVRPDNEAINKNDNNANNGAQKNNEQK